MALAALGSCVLQLWVMSTVKSALKRCQNGGEERASPVGRIDAACGLSLSATYTHTDRHTQIASLSHKSIEVLKKKTSTSNYTTWRIALA